MNVDTTLFEIYSELGVLEIFGSSEFNEFVDSAVASKEDEESSYSGPDTQAA